MKKKPASKPKRKPDPHRSTPLTPQERAILDQNLRAQLTPSAQTGVLEEIRDLKLRIALYERTKWPVPRFNYGDHVKLIPLDYVKARVIDLHILGATSTIEYDVRYFLDGKEEKCRVFEDELEAV